MNSVKKFLKAIIILIIALWVVFFALIGYAVITDYKPDEKVVISENPGTALLNDSVYTILTWNIGYCGLDDEMDFFYDGGTKVRTPKEKFSENYSAISGFLKNIDSVDFYLLQEVDRKSKRSFRTDEYSGFIETIKPSSSQFAINYDVFFVPLPPDSPMGKVLSGISIMGSAAPSSSIRYAFPGKYGFPKQLFMLDRCFLVNRYPLSNGKELVLINTHNEAFDPGEIRKAQMAYLKQFVLAEYSKGNYIIAGGDWNQCPPEFKAEFRDEAVFSEQMMLEKDYLPSDWKWAYDPSTPSNRTVTAAYKPGITATTVIDFFLLSPNIDEISVKCLDLSFRNSDHNPVILKARLK